VDDGSTDDTLRLAHAYAGADRRVRALRQANGGAAAARNKGLADSTGASKYVTFLDHDDVWEADALEVLVATLDSYPEAVAARGLSRYIGQRGEPLDPGELEVWGRRRVGVVGNRLVAWPTHAPTTLAASG